MGFLYGFLISCFLLSVTAQKDCKKCLPNDVYCDGLDVYYCMDGEKIPEVVKSCTAGQFCTDVPGAECATNAPATGAYCSASSGPCGSTCKTGQQFVCKSANEYSVCTANGPSATKRACPNETLCNEELISKGAKTVCASQSVLDFFQLEPTCGKAEPPKPGDTTALQKQCWNAKINGESNRHFFIPKEGDSTCKNYIYCEILGDSNMAAVAYTCSSGSSFNPKSQTCEDNYVCPTPGPAVPPN